MEVRLLVENPKARTRELRLGASTVIGRSADCNLRISSGQVSRHHCAITVADSRVSVRDLGSANGTEVDGQLIATGLEVPVEPGSTLVVGPLKFIFAFTQPDDSDRPSRPPGVDSGDIQGVIAATLDEDSTKDYLPTKYRRHSAAATHDGKHSSELDFVEVSPAAPAAAIVPSANADLSDAGDTVHDAELAEHARQAAERARQGDDTQRFDAGDDPIRLPEDDDDVIDLFEPAPSRPEESERTCAAEHVAEEVTEVGDAPPEKRKGWNLLGLFRRREPAPGSDSTGPARPVPPPRPKLPPRSASPESPAVEDEPDLENFFGRGN